MPSDEDGDGPVTAVGRHARPAGQTAQRHLVAECELGPERVDVVCREKACVSGHAEPPSGREVKALASQRHDGPGLIRRLGRHERNLFPALAQARVAEHYHGAGSADERPRRCGVLDRHGPAAVPGASARPGTQRSPRRVRGSAGDEQRERDAPPITTWCVRHRAYRPLSRAGRIRPVPTQRQVRPGRA